MTVRLGIEGEQAFIMRGRHWPGYRHDRVPCLFEHFYQGSAAQAGAAPGVGLGVAISRAILHVNEGRIEAANLAGGGALFIHQAPT